MGATPVNNELVIRSHRGPYTVRWGRPFAGLEEGLAPHEHLVIDARVAALYAGPLTRALAGRSVLRVEATEATKSLERIPAAVLALLAQGIRRDHTLVAVGGGIVQDLCAFLAAILFRGIAWRYYPTTLLAQADSCIGSKSSINVGGYKNQVGTFTPPQEIWIAWEVLDTLPEADLRSGIGEIIKVHLIDGWAATRALAADFPRLLKDRAALARAVRRALEIKQATIEADEFDQGERLLMNYGHSFGHAIESATAYGIPHGIAVTIGMDLANYVAWRFELLPRAVYDELHPLLASNYAAGPRVEIPREAFFAALARDKKNVASDLSLILMRGPGQVFRGRYPNDGRLRGVCEEYLRTVWAAPGGVLCPTP